MRLRVLDFGSETALRSQAVYHGIAQVIGDSDNPVLTLVNPTDPYVCVGVHQEIGKEVDEEFCAAQGLPIIRRHVGGGAVYLDENQMFFHFMYPRAKAPEFATNLYPRFIEPAVRTYRGPGNCRGIPADQRHPGSWPQDRRNRCGFDRQRDCDGGLVHVRLRHGHNGEMPESAVGEIPRQAEVDARRLHDHDDPRT